MQHHIITHLMEKVAELYKQGLALYILSSELVNLKISEIRCINACTKVVNVDWF